MDAVTLISPYEYIGNSLGKINQNFLNLQKLPVTLSAKYIQIDDFITSLRSQIVTNNAQVSGAASVKDTFRAEGDVVLGSNSVDRNENVIIYSSPIYLPHAVNASKALIFGNNVTPPNGDTANPSNFTGGNTRITNLYKTNAVTNRPDTLQTDGDFRVVNNFTVGGNLWLSGDAWVGNANTDNINVKSGNIYLDNFISSSQAITFGTSNTPKLYRSGNDLLEVEGSLEITQSVYVSGGVNVRDDINTTKSLNVSGSGKFTGVIHANLNSTGSTNDVVVEQATTFELATRSIDSRVWGSTLVDGSGTQNKVAKWTDGNTITDSSITDNGSLVTIGTGLATTAPVTVTGVTKTINATEVSVIFNVSIGSCTVTLPTASSNSGRWLYFKTTQNQTVVSNASDVVPLVGGSASTAILNNTAGKWAWLQSDGSNWIIMSAN